MGIREFILWIVLGFALFMLYLAVPEDGTIKLILGLLGVLGIYSLFVYPFFAPLLKRYVKKDERVIKKKVKPAKVYQKKRQTPIDDILERDDKEKTEREYKEYLRKNKKNIEKKYGKKIDEE